MCVPVCVCVCVSGGVSDTAVWALWNFIRIQHTACKMQQTGSSLEWQLRVCCHPELQLACQSEAAPRSFLHIHMFHLSSTPLSFFPPSHPLTEEGFPVITFFCIWLQHLAGVFIYFSFSKTLSFSAPHPHRLNRNLCRVLINRRVQRVESRWRVSITVYRKEKHSLSLLRNLDMFSSQFPCF